MPLTDRIARNIKPVAKPSKHSDGGGLYLYVSVSGSKLWRMGYRFHHKQKALYIGGYPAISLAAARARRDQAKQQLAEGIDPAEEVRREKIRRQFASGNTFSAIALELIEKAKAEGKAPATLKKKFWFLELLDADLGRMAISEITATDLIAPLRRIERQGNYETARRVRAFASQVFRSAIADGTWGQRPNLWTSWSFNHASGYSPRCDH